MEQTPPNGCRKGRSQDRETGTVPARLDVGLIMKSVGAMERL